MAQLEHAAGYFEWEEGFLKLRSKLIEEGKVKENLLFTIMCYGALRVTDATNLTLDNFKRNKIVLTEKKTKKTKIIPLRKEIKESMKLFFDKYGKKHQLFLNKYGDKPISSQYINRLLKRYVEKYNLSYHGNVSSHIFRKTLGRRFIDQHGADTNSMSYLQNYLNHASISTTSIYLGIQQDEINKMILDI